MSGGRPGESGAWWLFWWDVGVLAGLVGLPAMLGFFAGAELELWSRGPVPWRVLFAALGAVGGGLAAWRTLLVRRTRR